MVILTIVSLAAAAGMGGLLWRMVKLERQRANARIGALAAAIDLEASSIESSEASEAVVHRDPMPARGMFELARAPQRQTRAAMTVGVAFLMLATTAALVVAFGEPSRRARPSATAAAPSADTGHVLPLELVALRHERTGDRLTIRGVVRNPRAGATVRHVSAVILLLNADGDVITRERASVASDSLVPGGETTFMLTVPNSSDVGRYRVSFQTDNGVLAHVDRRT